MQTYNTPQYTIKILNGNTTLKTIHKKFTVGRSLKCDLRVQLPSVEEKHLVIYLDDRKYLVSGDDVMVNGTVVNGEGVFEYGDVFDVRGTRFVVMEDENKKDVVGTGGREMEIANEENVEEKKMMGVIERKNDVVSTDNNMKNDVLNEEPLITAAQSGDVAKTLDVQEEQHSDANVVKDKQLVNEGPAIKVPRMHQEVSKVIPKVELTNDTQEEDEEGLSTNYENDKITVIEEKIPAGELVIEEEVMHREIVKETISIDTLTKGKIAEEVAGNLKEEMRNDLKAGFVDEIRDELKDEVKDVIGSDGVRKLLVSDVMDRVSEEIKEKITGESVDKGNGKNAGIEQVEEKRKTVEMNNVGEQEVKDGTDQGMMDQNEVQEVIDKGEVPKDQVQDQKHGEVVPVENSPTKNDDLKEKEEVPEQKTQNVVTTGTSVAKDEDEIPSKRLEKESVKRVRKGKAMKKEMEHEEKSVNNEDIKKETKREREKKGAKNGGAKKEVELEEKGTRKKEIKRTKSAKIGKDVAEEKVQDTGNEESDKETKTSRKMKADATPKRVKKEVVEPETKRKGRKPSVAKKATVDTRRKGSVGKTAAARRRKK